jgi:cellulose synthase (UDP-forming)
VPEDFGSFCKQQLKWSRGVFEVTFAEIPRLFRKLSFWQKLSYFSIGTYYFVGATQFFFTILPFIFFFTGVLPARMSFVDFVVHGSFVAIFAVLIYLYVQRWMCDPSTERGIHWRGMVLKFACWPVFLMGFLLSVIDKDIPYIPTAKKAVTGYFTPFARPLVIQSLLFIITVFCVFTYRRFFMPESMLLLSAEKVWGMVAFAFIAFVMAIGGVLAALEAQNLTEEEPWSEIDLNNIKTS